MVIETIVGSISPEGCCDFAPIGICFKSWAQTETGDTVKMYLYEGTQTRANLEARGSGTINFCVDVRVFVETALFDATPDAVLTADGLPALAAGDSWQFRISHCDTAQNPAVFNAEITAKTAGTPFRGFCRAHAAVLEATIAATRLDYRPREELFAHWPYWYEVVEKTGGSAEKEAMERVREYLAAHGCKLSDKEE